MYAMLDVYNALHIPQLILNTSNFSLHKSASMYKYYTQHKQAMEKIRIVFRTHASFFISNINITILNIAAYYVKTHQFYLLFISEIFFKFLF